MPTGKAPNYIESARNCIFKVNTKNTTIQIDPSCSETTINALDQDLWSNLRTNFTWGT